MSQQVRNGAAMQPPRRWPRYASVNPRHRKIARIGMLVEQGAARPIATVMRVFRRAIHPAIDVRAAAAVRHGRPLALVDALPAQADAVRCALVAAAPQLSWSSVR